MRDARRRNCNGRRGAGYRSTNGPAGRPAPILWKSAAARAIPAGGAFTSPPRSNRDDASVLRPSRLLVLRMQAGWKYALSSAMRVVAPSISDSSPAHDATDRGRTLGVGDDEHVGAQRAIHAVERAETLAGARTADDEPPSSKLREVEGVHRLPELEHHVVGDVDDVVDRTDAGRFEPIAQPVG